MHARQRFQANRTPGRFPSPIACDGGRWYLTNRKNELRTSISLSLERNIERIGERYASTCRYRNDVLESSRHSARRTHSWPREVFKKRPHSDPSSSFLQFGGSCRCAAIQPGVPTNFIGESLDGAVMQWSSRSQSACVPQFLRTPNKTFVIRGGFFRGSKNAYTTPSSFNRVCLCCRPPPYPTSLPLLPMIRWQGTMIERGLRPLAIPTARAAAGLPTDFAISP